MTKRFTPFLTALLVGLPAYAQQEAPAYIVEKFKAMYPRTQFKEIRLSPVSGLYELVMGENIAYTDESGRYFVFGHLFDMKEQVDITAQKKTAVSRTEFPARFLNNAIKTVRGDGRRIVAVFSDPDCPYCKRLEAELARLENVTIYTFLFPLETLHSDAKTKAISVWCASDPAQAWNELMLAGKRPTLKACINPINDNLVLGSRLGVVGTPTLIATDGRTLPGAATAAQIDQWLDAARHIEASAIEVAPAGSR